MAKFKEGELIRMVKPPVHGPRNRGQFYDEFGHYPGDEESYGGYCIMKVGDVVTAQNSWPVNHVPNVYTKPSNGHCQPEECFVRFKMTNEERIEERKRRR